MGRFGSDERQALLTPHPINLPERKKDQLLDVHGGSSEEANFTATMINFLKGCVASGFLSLPYALSMSGYVAGTIAMVIICIVSTHCVHFLIQAKEHLCAKHGETSMSYGELARLSIGNWGGKLTNLSLAVSQLGFCTVYVLFYIENMSQVFPQLTRLQHTFILAPVLVVLSWIKSLKILAYPSSLGTLCILYSASVIYTYCIDHLARGTQEEKQPGNGAVVFDGIANFPIMFGNTIYAFEAVALVLPLQNNMKNRSEFGLMLNVSMVIVFVLYISFALMGYLTFGSSVDGAITTSLPGDWVYSTVKVSLSVMMLQSYALQFYPAITIMEPNYLPRVQAFFASAASFHVVRHLVRASLVAITVVFAMVVPNIGLAISLVGSVGAGSLSLILPPLIHVLALKDELTPAQKALDWVYFVFGVVGSVAGTFVSVKSIVEEMT